MIGEAGGRKRLALWLSSFYISLCFLLSSSFSFSFFCLSLLCIYLSFLFLFSLSVSFFFSSCASFLSLLEYFLLCFPFSFYSSVSLFFPSLFSIYLYRYLPVRFLFLFLFLVSFSCYVSFYFPFFLSLSLFFFCAFDFSFSFFPLFLFSFLFLLLFSFLSFLPFSISLSLSLSLLLSFSTSATEFVPELAKVLEIRNLYPTLRQSCACNSVRGKPSRCQFPPAGRRDYAGPAPRACQTGVETKLAEGQSLFRNFYSPAPATRPRMLSRMRLFFAHLFCAQLSAYAFFSVRHLIF